MATKTAKKTTKKTIETIDFSTSIDSIVKTAKNVNAQVIETVVDVADDLRANSIRLKDTAVDQVKEVIEDIDVKGNVKRVAKAAKDINKYSLETTEEILDEVIQGGEKWQKMTTKAVKGSLHLAERQQEIVFDTLDALKAQMVEGTNRFVKLFSKN